jgi:anti-sigma factor RsiW
VDEIQALLDGELSAAAEEALRAHAALCPTCHAELEGYQQLLATLRAAPEWAPSEEVRERILDRVLPSRIRHRYRQYAQIFGWAYAGATAVLTFATLNVVSRPELRAAALQWAGDMALGGIRLLVTTLDVLVVAVSRVPERVRDLEEFFRLFSPLGRALERSFELPVIQGSFWAAAIACAVLLYWMRARERRARRGGPHAAILVG